MKIIPELKPALFKFDVGLPGDTSQNCTEPDFARAVDDAIGSVEQFFSKNKANSVCIIVDDYTRSTPTPEILSCLLPALKKKGIDRESIFFIFASGSHRLMTEKEKRARLSDDVFENYRSIDHCFFDKDQMINKGSFDDGNSHLHQ